MENTKLKLDEMSLAGFRRIIDEVTLAQILDADQVETALSKTETGYVYEIRYRQTGKHFIADAVVINGLYEKLAENMSLDRLRETVEGLAVQVGRLANVVAESKKPN